MDDQKSDELNLTQKNEISQPQLQLRQLLSLLKTNISDRIKGIESRLVFYRKKSFFVYIASAFLATISTILLGLKDDIGEYVRIIVLILSATITLINAYNAFYNYKELWAANNDALNRFYSLQFSIEFYENGTLNLDETVIQGFKENYQAILNDLNQQWQRARTDSYNLKK